MQASANSQGVVGGATWEATATAVPSRYYQFKSDLEKADAEHLAGHMDAVFASYMAIFSKLPVRAKQPARLNLYLFADQKTYNAFLGAKFGHDGEGSWGKCIRWGQSYWLVGWKGDHSLEEMQALLQHEGFHQVAGQIFPDLPLWANEGLAELFERGVVVGGLLALGEISSGDYRRLHAAIEQDSLIPFDRFFSMSDNEWAAHVRSGHARLNYLQAWSLVHFLLYAQNGKYEQGFMRFLVQLNRDIGWQQAFVAAFGMPDFRTMEREWLAYIKEEIPTDYRETVRRLDFLAAGTAKLADEKVFPTSVEELREALRKAKFEHSSALYGEKRTFSASDIEAFTVPGATEDPSRRFVLADRRNRPMTGSKGRLSGPPKILAVGKMPKSFTATLTKRGREYAYALAAGDPIRVEASEISAAPPKSEGTEGTEPFELDNRPKVASQAAPIEDATKALRTWRSADGRFSVEARLTGVLGGAAYLKKADGTTIKVPSEKLSAEDRAFLEERKR